MKEFSKEKVVKLMKEVQPALKIGSTCIECCRYLSQTACPDCGANLCMDCFNQLTNDTCPCCGGQNFY